MPIDPQIEKSMDQSFAERYRATGDSLTRFSSRQQFTESESQQGYLSEKRLIGAEAANTLEQHGLANIIMQLMASMKAANNLPPETKPGA